MRLEICQKCLSQTAVWFYMPDSGNNERAYCDSCVPRGCSCNQDPIFEEYIDENGEQQYREIGLKDEPTDEQGRLYPCCEFSYEPEGRDLDAPPMTDEEIAAFEKEWQEWNANEQRKMGR